MFVFWWMDGYVLFKWTSLSSFVLYLSIVFVSHNNALPILATFYILSHRILVPVEVWDKDEMPYIPIILSDARVVRGVFGTLYSHVTKQCLCTYMYMML